MEWLDWHIRTGVEGTSGPVLRLLRDDQLVDEVPLTPGEMASVKRKFEARVTESKGAQANTKPTREPLEEEQAAAEAIWKKLSNLENADD